MLYTLKRYRFDTMRNQGVKPFFYAFLALLTHFCPIFGILSLKQKKNHTIKSILNIIFDSYLPNQNQLSSESLYCQAKGVLDYFYSHLYFKDTQFKADKVAF